MRMQDVQPRRDAIFLVLVLGVEKITAKPFTSGIQAAAYANRRRENLRPDELPARIEVHRLDGTSREGHGDLLLSTMSLPGGPVS